MFLVFVLFSLVFKISGFLVNWDGLKSCRKTKKSGFLQELTIWGQYAQLTEISSLGFKKTVAIAMKKADGTHAFPNGLILKFENGMAKVIRDSETDTTLREKKKVTENEERPPPDFETDYFLESNCHMTFIGCWADSNDMYGHFLMSIGGTDLWRMSYAKSELTMSSLEVQSDNETHVIARNEFGTFSFQLPSEGQIIDTYRPLTFSDSQCKQQPDGMALITKMMKAYDRIVGIQCRDTSKTTLIRLESGFKFSVISKFRSYRSWYWGLNKDSITKHSIRISAIEFAPDRYIRVMLERYGSVTFSVQSTGLPEVSERAGVRCAIPISEAERQAPMSLKDLFW